MRILSFVFLMSLSFTGPLSAQDFIVDLVEENYKETRAQFSYDPIIYHSIQINSAAGPKMIVLTGSDYTYRKWLRHYMAENTHFIIKVDASVADQFISAKVFKADLSSIHPFDKSDWVPEQIATSDPRTLSGDNFFLIIDQDETRARLLGSVSKKMGFRTVSFKDQKAGLSLFMLQPEKFKMVVINHSFKGGKADVLIDKILSIKHNIPILVNAGYKKKSEFQSLTSKYSGFRSVHIKPVVLKDFQKTIKTLILNTNA